MKIKKILAAVLACAMVCTAIGIPVFAADIWDGTAVDTKWYNTSDTSFTINTAAGLAGLAAIVNGTAGEIAQDSFSKKTITLGADINLAGHEWTPIGTSTNQFLGTFDGGGKVISNLKISGNNSDVGLFGFTSGGDISNFSIENASVEGYLDVGTVAGTPYTTTYSNITVRGTIQVDGYAYVGVLLVKTHMRI